MTHNDILIIGDSYAENQGTGMWPNLLCERLTGHSGGMPRGRGFGGGSWWAVRNLLLKELANHVPQVLILVHTDPYRLPDAHGYSISMKWAVTAGLNTDNLYTPQQLEEKGQASKAYYEHLFFPEYHDWAQLAWFREVDTIIEQHQIPYVIHMMIYPFTPKMDYEFGTGITITERLNNHCNTASEYYATNHYTAQGNQIKAQCLHRLIVSTEPFSKGLRSLRLEENGLPPVNEKTWTPE